MTVTLSARGGQIRLPESEVLIEFRNPSWELVDVGSVKFDLDMNMPGMVMHSGGPAEKTGLLGQYRVKLKPDMAGEWTAKLSFGGPQGKGETSLTVNVKP